MTKVTKVKKGEAEEVSLPKPASYAKINDEFYALMKIEGNIDIEKEMREYYEQELTKAKKGVVSNFLENNDNDWNASLNKLDNFKNKHKISIPDNMLGKCVCYNRHLGALIEMKSAIYCPTEIVTRKSYLVEDTERLEDESERIKSNDTLFRGIESNNITVHFKNEIKIPVMVGFLLGTGSDKGRVVIYGIDTFHCMSSNLCIGNHTARDYYNLNTDNLSKQISKINRLSPARGAVKDIDGNFLYSFKTLQARSNIISIESEVREWTV